MLQAFSSRQWTILAALESPISRSSSSHAVFRVMHPCSCRRVGLMGFLWSRVERRRYTRGASGAPITNEWIYVYRVVAQFDWPMFARLNRYCFTRPKLLQWIFPNKKTHIFWSVSCCISSNFIIFHGCCASHVYARQLFSDPYCYIRPTNTTTGP